MLQNRLKNKSVGIIGAGNIGSMLAEYFAYFGCKVFIANSGKTKLRFNTNSVFGVAIEEVIQKKDLVVVALPMKAIGQLPKNLFAKSDTNTLVIDTCNYFPNVRDDVIPAIEEGFAESEWVSQQLGISVIKAFNCITALSFSTLGLPTENFGRICIPIAGDNESHKLLLANIIDMFGFDTIDIGLLNKSWKLQPGAPAYCADVDKLKLKQLLDNSKHDLISTYRKTMMSGAKEAVKTFGSLEAAVAQTGRPRILPFINK
jgi:8-hydroxy-5-deazaflavin:NADPH oxidoreductase